MRYRFQGKVYRADTKNLALLDHYDTYAELDVAQDLTLSIEEGITTTIQLSDYGLTSVTDLYLTTSQMVTVSLNGESFECQERIMMTAVDLTAITILNSLGTPATVRVIFGGLSS